MKNATIHNAAQLNEFELILACADFEKRYPGDGYNVYPGNNCIWISAGLLDLYYIFRDGKIAEVQID